MDSLAIFIIVMMILITWLLIALDHGEDGPDQGVEKAAGAGAVLVFMMIFVRIMGAFFVPIALFVAYAVHVTYNDKE